MGLGSSINLVTKTKHTNIYYFTWENMNEAKEERKNNEDENVSVN